MEVLQLEDQHFLGYAGVIRVDARGSACFRVHSGETNTDVWQMATFRIEAAEWDKLQVSLRKAGPEDRARPAFAPRGTIMDLGETRLFVRAGGQWSEYRSFPLSAAIQAVVNRIWDRLDAQWVPAIDPSDRWTHPYVPGEGVVLEPGRVPPSGRRASCIPEGWERPSP